MKRRPEVSLQNERGATLVLFAILVPLLLIPIGAIAVDIGFWYTNAKKAQTTADAAALAAAREIPTLASVQSRADEYVGLNMPGATRFVEYPYVPDDGPNMGLPQTDEVEVEVSHPAPSFFGRIFGVFGVSSTRRAVAEQFKIPGTMAIYVNDTSCIEDESLSFTGEDMHIDGWVHTEGGYYISVSPDLPQPNYTANKGTQLRASGDPNSAACPSSINPTNQVAQFGPYPPQNNLPDLSDTLGWPVFYTPSQFGWYEPPVLGTASPNRCLLKGTTIEIDDVVIKVDGVDVGPHGGVLPTGIYCARDSFTIDTSPGTVISGRITALAREIQINTTGNGLDDLEAYAGSPDPVLFFVVPNESGWPLGPPAEVGPPPGLVACDHANELRMTGDNLRWDGLIFSPCGRVLINGNANLGRGSIVAKRVRINGGPFHFTGENNFSATIELGLVE